jgi:hypothetical protein
MPLGEEGDFRTIGFMMKNLFPGQDHVGGPGSAMLHQWTQPSGGTNMSSPVPPLTDTALTFPNITFPGITFPNQLPPVIISGIPGGGTTSSGISVEDLATPGGPYTSITLLQFDGTGVSVSNPTPGTAVVNISAGGGGGGSTIEYGQITNASKGTYANWTYTVQRYASGVVSGSPVTAFNMVEINNNSTIAYGYSITGATYDKINGTSYYIRSVPVGTWVRMEYTDAIPGGFQYWFNAANRVDGGC